MKRTFWWLFGLFVLAAAPARAQRVDSPYRFVDTSQQAGPFAAYISADEGAVGLGATSGAAFGARYAIRISGPFMLEVETLYFPTERAVLDTVVVDSAFRKVGTAKQALLVGTAALRLNLTGARTWHGIMPYLSFGGGVTTQLSSDAEDIDVTPLDARLDFGTGFAGTLGAGFEFFPTDRLSLRVDGRNLLWKVNTPAALLRGPLGVTMPKDEWVRNLSASAGISVHF
jgi:hypothetical protein